MSDTDRADERCGPAISGAGAGGGVDVRDMVCAQALALVARAAARVPRGDALLVRYNAEDVKRDLLAWSARRGYAIEDAEPEALHIIRRAGTTG